ncbi:nitrite reductase small subunit NirD [Acinetobacter nectaris]|uniref:nitrite reductase small subunit NirD n=1 Tax=Acinetobacter nectaris TaxID=1219382 RepID=UPI001F028D04|nr:nitrite reductase small subunit NirD [Acinetobacter nectaris]MCF8999190.1 nitrite reductase small subunit NirD [Acinetobacter nectaris]MCF9026485.1 nitrite reductase small subunit NirD [Acinetobacter nectaris]
MNKLKIQETMDWIDVCALDEITPNTGVGILVDQQQIAVFRVGHEHRVYALSNQDPFSQSFVMSRGIIGDIQGERVVASPIYKQHFSLVTGRCLEDGQHSLKSFATKVEHGRVFVNRVPKKAYLTNISSVQHKLKLVLVGNGLAGMRCLEDLLDMAPDRYDITVIGAEPRGNYNRIMLSPVLSGDKTLDDIMLHQPSWYRQNGIRLITGDPVVQIDRVRKQLHTQKGIVVDYDRMILAMGSTPFIPNIEGTGLKGVMSFRDIDDVNQMLQYAKTYKNAVVIGAGLLGLEAAYGLKQQGMNVTVVHLSDRIMNRQLDTCASALLQKSIEAKGIQVMTNASTKYLEGEDGHVKSVHLASGEVISADLVIFAVGIRPNIRLAKQAGLHCNRGIIVNDTMQTFDPSIYAVGECIEHRQQTFGLVEPLWGQAFICANQLAEHGGLIFKAPTVPTQLKVSGCDVFSAGNIEPRGDFEDVILNDEKRSVYKRIIIKNDRVIGAVLFGDTEDGAWYAELIADQTVIRQIRHKLLFGRDFAMKQAS